ncbi:hypothetical protein E9229_000175 [Paeniglutamicibacter cryotolerans]|uniref:Uncharacterized protein n=2 Tax=Paeniglutamicibacter cryotolerans TaxID=670079 RepID=A0A839QGX8_9MICC|nr:hypothetical protein [Paeniglutamicibacter cryotolerans]
MALGWKPLPCERFDDPAMTEPGNRVSSGGLPRTVPSSKDLAGLPGLRDETDASWVAPGARYGFKWSASAFDAVLRIFSDSCGTENNNDWPGQGCPAQELNRLWKIPWNTRIFFRG